MAPFSFGHIIIILYFIIQVSLSSYFLPSLLLRRFVFRKVEASDWWWAARDHGKGTDSRHIFIERETSGYEAAFYQYKHRYCCTLFTVSHYDTWRRITRLSLDLSLQITHQTQERLTTPPGSTSPTLFEQWCGFFYVPQESDEWKCCETGTTAFHPYQRRLESLTLFRRYYKDSTFFSAV